MNQHAKNIQNIVRMLNRAFNKSHWFANTRIAPFKGVLTKERGWLIVCEDHYTWSDDPRFKRVLNVWADYDFPFEFEFEGIKTIRLTKLMLLK